MSLSTSRLFYQGWLILLMIILLAGVLRLWQIGAVPPGLYRDEAQNGLDALGVLDGEYPIFFEANNGREPLYIYLTAAMVSFFGRTALAVRLSAALIGTATTLTTYLFVREWFDKRTGLIAALLWATTVWAIHLSRIGFRAILMPFVVSLFLWLATIAYRRRHFSLLLLTGITHGAIYYTYLAARLIPLFLICFLIYRWWCKKQIAWRVIAVMLVGTLMTLLPLGWYVLTHPESAITRTGQVSIFSPVINQGDLWGTFGVHFGRTLAMFFWQGDTIIRHNPAGRPVFDWLITIPFLIGLFWCIVNWRQTRAGLPLLWCGVLLWGTILAEDAPHFLRSVGVLPVLLIFPAVGLSQLLRWSKLPPGLRKVGITLILMGSLLLTVRDYFVDYAPQANTNYLFETAARELVEEVQQARVVSPDSTHYVDQRFVDGWPSITFLLDSSDDVVFVDPTENSEIVAPASFFLWPFTSHTILTNPIQTATNLSIDVGAMARGDLEPEPYPLYVYYRVDSQSPSELRGINFADQLWLTDSAVVADENVIDVALAWQVVHALPTTIKAFVQVLDRETQTVIGQWDAVPGGIYWNTEWWHPALQVREEREISLLKPYDADEHVIIVGVYDDQTLTRLNIFDEQGRVTGDYWEVTR